MELMFGQNLQNLAINRVNIKEYPHLIIVQIDVVEQVDEQQYSCHLHNDNHLAQIILFSNIGIRPYIVNKITIREHKNRDGPVARAYSQCRV